VSHEAVLELAAGALTYRQLHYWTQQGLVPAHRHHNGTGAHLTGTEHGSGTTYGWEPDAAARIATAAQLVRATGMRPEAAWLLARDGALAVVDASAMRWLTLHLRTVPKPRG
jgi:hypothetical protein